MSDGISAVDLVAALATIREYVDAVALGEPVDGTISDRWRAVEALQQTAKTIGLARAKIEVALRDDLGKGKHPLDDGTILHIGQSRSLTEWNKAAIRSEINRAALRPNDDGEATTTAAEAVDEVWKYVDVAVGRTKVLGAFLQGGLDEYCHQEWKPIIERRQL